MTSSILPLIKYIWFSFCCDQGMKLKSLSQRKEEDGIKPSAHPHKASKKVQAGRNKKKATGPKKQSTGEGRK